MRSTLERELKLDAAPGFALPELEGVPLAERVFTSTYHDTPARSLGRAGITLRRRVENGKSLWQLKLPRGGARAELEEPGGPAGPPPALARLLEAHRRHGKLEPVATLRTRRAGVLVGGVAEVTVDRVDVLDAGRAAGGFAEIEVELVNGGGIEHLERLGKRLRRAGAKRSAGTPKLMRVLHLPAPPKVDGDAPFLAQFVAVLEEQLRQLEARDPGVRLGEDPDDVHKFRVATRRTRALIHETRGLLGDTLAPLGEELKWLAGVLGPVRDLDVLIEHLGEEVARLDHDAPAGGELLAGLARQRDECRAVLVDALESERYQHLLASFDTALATLPPLDADGGTKVIARDAFRRVRRAAKKLPQPPSDDELHDLRKKAKRARYAAELAQADRAAEAVKELQDVIGVHQDAVVAEERLRSLARARTAVAAGRLIELERARRAQARATYEDALERALAAGAKAFGR